MNPITLSMLVLLLSSNYVNSYQLFIELGGVQGRENNDLDSIVFKVVCYDGNGDAVDDSEDLGTYDINRGTDYHGLFENTAFQGLSSDRCVSFKIMVYDYDRWSSNDFLDETPRYSLTERCGVRIPGLFDFDREYSFNDDTKLDIEYGCQWGN
mmetsp:Transcript_68256/g.61347  ORF Transcript_68256/g.61347 Transcript_68256/m.61347 type:complete len:153 (+) Transcript_68256:141-599(+)